MLKYSRLHTNLPRNFEDIRLNRTALALKHDNTVLCWGVTKEGSADIASSTPVAVVGSGGTGTLSNIQQIDGGSYFNCALKTEGTVWCWGRGGYGRLGNGGTSDSSSPVQVKGENNSGSLTNVAQISLGGSTACALTNDGKVLCWGRGTSGELGLGVGVTPDTDIGSGHTPDLGIPWSVKVVDIGEPRNGRPLRGITQVSVGSNHVCALN